MRLPTSRTWTHPSLRVPAVLALMACGQGDGLPDDVARYVQDDPTIVLLDSVPELMKRADIPGLQLAYLEDGQLMMTAAIGYTSSETEDPVDAETVFEAASMSKPVFAYAVLRMADRGEWDLDEPLWNVLEYDRLAHDDRARQLTTRMVLSHTTGLPNWGGDPLQFNADPGERWGYSGEGFVYLQRAVEARTGLTLEEIATREVFEPLGMSSTHYVWVAEYDSLGATPHDELGFPTDRRTPDEGNAAGSLHTTATDFGRFLVAVLSGEGLELESHAAMLSPEADLAGGAWGDDEEAKSHLFWGLGWGLQEGRRGTALWQWGDQGTARGFVLAYPEDGFGLVYFTNSQNGLAIGPALYDLVFDDDLWAFDFLDYGRYDDPGRVARLGVTRAFIDDGTEAGMEAFDRMKADYPNLLDEGDVNSLGYVLLRRDAVEQAIWVFERNTVDYPESSNVWDSLGEGLRKAGRVEEAIANYRKSIELDPGNDNARRFITEMEEELAAATAQ